MRKISIILGLALALVCATEVQAHHAGFAHLAHANGLHRNNSLHHNNLAQFRAQQFLLQNQNFGGYNAPLNANLGGCLPPLPAQMPANFGTPIYNGGGVPRLNLIFGGVHRHH